MRLRQHGLHRVVGDRGIPVVHDQEPGGEGEEGEAGQEPSDVGRPGFHRAIVP